MHTEPGGDHQGTEVLSPELQAVKSFLQERYPNVKFQYLAEGSSAYIFTDADRERVYKVGRPPLDQDPERIDHNRQYFLEEAKHLRLFSNAGWAPMLHDSVAPGDDGRFLLTMDYIRSKPIDDAEISSSEIQAQKEQLFAFFKEQRLIPGDIEVVWDLNKLKIQIVDLGGIYPFSERMRYRGGEKEGGDLYPGLSNDEVYETILKQRFDRFFRERPISQSGDQESLSSRIARLLGRK